MSGFHYQKSTRTLTLKQRRFLVGYQAHSNATRAARDAGFSEKHAASAGWRLLQHPLVKAELASNPDGREVLDLPSGLQLSFTFRGQPVTPGVALEVSKAAGALQELELWRGGLALLCRLVNELEDGG